MEIESSGKRPTWYNSTIELLSLTDKSLFGILDNANQKGVFKSSSDYRMFLMCLLRDNMLPLKNRVIALLLLFSDNDMNSAMRSRFLFLLFDLIDNTECEVEKWICYHLALKDLMTLSVGTFSPQVIVADFHKIIEKFPITEDIISTVNKLKTDYYREQISSPDLFPFMSFDFAYYHFNSYPNILPDLSEYLVFYEEQNQCLGMSVPSFDRPSLEFTPTREEFLFVPPQIASKSFLYSRIEKPALDQSLRKYHLSWQKTLEKEEYTEILNSSAVFSEFQDFLLSPLSQDKSKKLSSFMEFNLELCHGLITLLLKEKNKKCCERLLMDTELTLYTLDVSSFIVLQNGVTSDCIVQYIKKCVNTLCEDSTKEVIVKCLCFFILGCYKKKLFDESVIHDTLIDLKSKYPNLMELSYTIYSLFGKTNSM